MSPEAAAREKIDAPLVAVGGAVGDNSNLVLEAALGQFAAIEEDLKD